MISKIDKNSVRQRRHARVRKSITGTAETPRMNVYRSLNHIYVQVIDDRAGNAKGGITIAAASTMDKAVKEQIVGLSKTEVELRAYEALKQVGLPDECFYQSPFELSGGQKRRVAIAGVLAMKPEILILDEPTAGLDPKGRDEILGQVKKLHEEGNITVVLVSHSMEDVANYVNRIVVMNRGEILFDDVPKKVFAHYKELETIGLAAPQVTYMMHQLLEEGFPVRTDATTIKEAAAEILRVMR